MIKFHEFEKNHDFILTDNIVIVANLLLQAIIPPMPPKAVLQQKHKPFGFRIQFHDTETVQLFQYL